MDVTWPQYISDDEIPKNGYVPIHEVHDPDVVALTYDIARALPYLMPSASLNRYAIVVMKFEWLKAHDETIRADQRKKDAEIALDHAALEGEPDDDWTRGADFEAKCIAKAILNPLES